MELDSRFDQHYDCYQLHFGYFRVCWSRLSDCPIDRNFPYDIAAILLVSDVQAHQHVLAHYRRLCE